MTNFRFIFMLTRNDATIPNARCYVTTALKESVEHIGFKDIGVSANELKELNRDIKQAGATSYLEMVSLDERSELESARVAVEIGVDVLLGGTHVPSVLSILAGSGIEYYPFAGRIEGHPSILRGTVEETVSSAKAIADDEGVSGLDLLAYRSSKNTDELMRRVCAAVGKPVIVAGSIGTKARIKAVKDAGAAGFTIGTAALNGEYESRQPDLRSQLRSIVRDATNVGTP